MLGAPVQTILALSLALLTIGCSAPTKGGAPAKPGPNYSTSPCADNCGRDAACVSSCSPVSNQTPLPTHIQR